MVTGKSRRPRVHRRRRSPTGSRETGSAFLRWDPLFDCLFSFWFPHFVLSCSPSGSKLQHTQPALDFKRNIGSSYYPRFVNNPVRKNDLIHEWTCLFIECHHDAWYLLHQSPLCMFINNPSLSSQYGMCRVLFILNLGSLILILHTPAGVYTPQNTYI